MYDIFLSYAREDQETAYRLYKSLTDLGYRVWFDIENLIPGQTWQTEIENAIRNSSVFLALLSKNSITKTGYVQKELKIALQFLDEHPYGETYLIPIRIDNVGPRDPKLKSIQYADFFISWETGLSKLKLALDAKFTKKSERKDFRQSGTFEKKVPPKNKIEALSKLFEQRFSTSGFLRFIRWQKIERDILDEIEEYLNQRQPNWIATARTLNNHNLITAGFFRQITETTRFMGFGQNLLDDETAKVAEIWSFPKLFGPPLESRVPRIFVWMADNDDDDDPDPILFNDLQMEGIAVSYYRSGWTRGRYGPDLIDMQHQYWNSCVKIFWLTVSSLKSDLFMPSLQKSDENLGKEIKVNEISQFTCVITLTDLKFPGFLANMPKLRVNEKNEKQVINDLSSIVDLFLENEKIPFK